MEAPAARFPSKPGAAVLMIGGGHAIQSALAEALMRHGMDLETAPADTAVSSAVAAAPDLILLVGDAAQNGGTDILMRLAQSPLSSTVPVAILADDPTLGKQLNALRHGAAAVIRRSASVDEIAERVAALARQPAGLTADGMGEIMLQDLLNTLSERLRSVLLSADSRETADVRLLLKDGRGVAGIIDDFAERMQKHVARAEAVEYELDQHARGKATLLGAEGTAGAFSTADIRGLRVVIADDHPARADAVAHELRTSGATVLVTDLQPTAELFQRLRQLDPTAFIIGNDHAEGRGAELLQRIRSDSRLRWSSRVAVHWDDIWPGVADGVQRMHGRLASTEEAERSLKDRAALSATFDLRLETLGPARLLRALVELPRPLRVTLYNPRIRVQVDLSESLVAGAVGEAFSDDGEHKLEGYPALSALLTVGSGRIQIERVERPACLNVMSPVEVALEVADTEPRPISPSSLFSDVQAPSSLPPPRPSAPNPTPLPAPAPVAFADSGDVATGPAELLRRRIALPVWALCLLLIFAIAIATGVALMVTSSPPEVSQRSESPSRRLAPPSPASTSLPDRARTGDPGALAELERRQATEPTLADVLALAEGRAAEKLNAVERLRTDLAASPKQAPGPEQIRKLLDLARDPRAAPNAQELIASLPSPIAADLLYEVWIRTPARTAATELAEQLVYTPPVLEKASPALRVALDLRRVNKCEDVVAILPRLKQQGDKRSLRPLAGLNERLGCKKASFKCLACVPNRALVSATNAAKRRGDPKF